MWNYRIVIEDKGTEEEWWSIREVFYNKNGEICGITTEPIAPIGVDMKELETDMAYMKLAMWKDPIILDEDFVFGPWDFDITKGE